MPQIEEKTPYSNQEAISESAENSEGICNKLAQYGIAFVPSYLSGEKLTRTQAEFDRLLEEDFDAATLIKRNDKVHRIIDFSALEAFPTILKLHKNELFDNVGKDFFSPYRHTTSAVYAGLTKEPAPLSHEWHMDMGPPLVKFFLYINDVDNKNGAFGYDLGSHRSGFLRRMYLDNRYELNPQESLPLLYVSNPEQDLINPMRIIGKAGDLIIFNTYGFHSAGNIEPGHKRKIIRYHTAPATASGENAADNACNEYFNIAKHASIPLHLIPDHRRARPPPLKHFREYLDDLTLIETPAKQDNASNEFLPPFADDDSIAVFAAGPKGIKTIEYLSQTYPKLNILGFGDNDESKRGTTINGFEVMSAKRLIEQKPDWIIIANKQRYIEISLQLSSLSFPTNRMVQFEVR